MEFNKYAHKELSWLAFNARVLQEADKPMVPLNERIKFLGIYSNNLDEFFRVRVAILRRLASLSGKQKIDGINPSEILKQINAIVMQQSIEFGRVYENIIADFEKENIFIINEKQLNEEQAAFVRDYFVRYVRPRIMPLLITRERELPDLKDEAIYLAVQLKTYTKKRDAYALVEVPSNNLGRFIKLPGQGDKQFIILLDDVIRYELKDVFYMFDFDEIQAYTIKLTRDAELDINDDISENYIKQIAQGLEKRKEAHPVRFVHDKTIPVDFLDLLLKKLKFSKDDAIIKGGRYHNFKDFMGFPYMGKPHLEYPSLAPIPHPEIPYRYSIFSILKKRDILIHFPYHSFLHFIDVLREASIDPLVKEIKITIYRVAKQSSVMNALLNAARNGKKVTAVLSCKPVSTKVQTSNGRIGLKKRGVRVIYGVPGLKVHSKLCLITRNEKGKLVSYVGVGTGNFNEDSAKVFSDQLLLTRHEGITKEATWVFDFFDKNYKVPPFKHLLVSPFKLRHQLLQLINNEIKLAKSGKKAYIYLKLNNLVDPEMIQKLYQAKAEGVDVRLNIRGMMSLVPNFSSKVEPIPAIGIIDRNLEHSRLYIFGNNGDEKIYISSADWMSRNLDRRVEVACPIYDKKLKAELMQMWDLQWNDTSSARVLDNEFQNMMKLPLNGETPLRSQTAFYKFLNSKAAQHERS